MRSFWKVATALHDWPMDFGLETLTSRVVARHGTWISGTAAIGEHHKSNCKTQLLQFREMRRI